MKKPIFMTDGVILDDNGIKKKSSLFRWQPHGSLLAVVPPTRDEVRLLKQNGDVGHIFETEEGGIEIIEWNNNGDVIAIIQNRRYFIIWNVSSDERNIVETGGGVGGVGRESSFTFASWSHSTTTTSTGLLAIGTSKGSLIIYDHTTGEKNTVLGRHQGIISCGAWTTTGIENDCESLPLLILGGSDGLVSVSDGNGDAVTRMGPLPDERLPVSIVPVCCCPNLVKGNGNGSLIISIMLAGGGVVRYRHVTSREPERIIGGTDLECESQAIFHSAPSSIENCLIVGSRSGKILWSDVSQQTVAESSSFQSKLVSLTHGVASGENDALALANEQGEIYLIRPLSCKGMRPHSHEAVANLNTRNDVIDDLRWSYSGDMITVGKSNGATYSFLIRTPNIYSGHNGCVAYLSSFREISINDADGIRTKISLESDDVDSIVLGTDHVAVLDSKRCLKLYPIINALNPELELKFDLKSKPDCPIQKLLLNRNYIAVLSDGIITVQRIFKMNRGNEKTKIPLDMDNDIIEHGLISCFIVSEDFLIYGTEHGIIAFYHFETSSILIECTYQHGQRVERIISNNFGTSVVFVDKIGNGFFLDPNTCEIYDIPDFPKDCRDLFWDTSEPLIFFASDFDSQLHTFVVTYVSIRGLSIVKYGSVHIDDNSAVTIIPRSFSIDPDLLPIMAIGGRIVCQSKENGQVQTISSPSCDIISNVEEEPIVSFCRFISLNKLEKAWKIALDNSFDQKKMKALANKAMEVLDISLAMQVFASIGDAGLVFSLEELRWVEDKRLLAGHVATIFTDYDLAEECFLDSDPFEALMMRKYLRDWPRALDLAQKLFPHEIKSVSIAYAQELELAGDYKGSLNLLENVIGQHDLITENDQNIACFKGIATAYFHLDNISRGLKFAQLTKDSIFAFQCVKLLLETNNGNLDECRDISGLYELAGDMEKALGSYIRFGDLQKASNIVNDVDVPSLRQGYASLCEKSRKYSEAVDHYKAAKNIKDAVRLYIDKVKNIEEAIKLVRSCPDTTAALMIANFCREKKVYRKESIEFFIISGKSDLAISLAKKHNLMDYFVSLDGEINQANAEVIAIHFESTGNLNAAAVYFSKVPSHHRKSLNLFIQCNDFNKATTLVCDAKDMDLTNTLINHLSREEPKQLFRLYIKLKKFNEAVQAVVKYVENDQASGKYMKARDLLVEAISMLEKKYIPRKLWHSFVILHSYYLAKSFAKIGDHEKSSRLLIRVAKNVDEFCPKDRIKILISAVIECEKSGLKKSSHQWATICSKDFKADLDNTVYKRKLFSIVRRPSFEEDKKENLTPCPYSNELIPEFSLECHSSVSNYTIPMCIVSGKHMVLDDWTICPGSGMPALLSEYTKDKSNSLCDPLSGVKLNLQDLKKVSIEEAKLYIQTYNEPCKNI